MNLEKWRGYITQRTNLRLFLGMPVAIFLLLFGFMFLNYRGEQSQQYDLETRMNRLRTSAAAPAQRLQQVRAEFESLQEALPPADLKETDVYELLLVTVQEKGLDAQISYRGETRKQVDTSSYRALLFALNVSGDFEKVWELVQELDAGPKGLETLVLEKVNLSPSEKARALVEFAVYTQLPEVGTAGK